MKTFDFWTVLRTSWMNWKHWPYFSNLAQHIKTVDPPGCPPDILLFTTLSFIIRSKSAIRWGILSVNSCLYFCFWGYYVHSLKKRGCGLIIVCNKSDCLHSLKPLSHLTVFAQRVKNVWKNFHTRWYTLVHVFHTFAHVGTRWYTVNTSTMFKTRRNVWVHIRTRWHTFCTRWHTFCTRWHTFCTRFAHVGTRWYFCGTRW